MGPEELEPRTIEEWCTDLAGLYNRHDQHRTPVDVWIATMSYASVMGESIRRVHYGRLMEGAVHAFAWMCAFVTRCNQGDDLVLKCDHSFCDMVYFKYPQKCGHCGENPCRCNPLEMEGRDDKPADYRKLYNTWRGGRGKSKDLIWWLDTFRSIYGGRIALMTLETIGFHFLEEASEEAFALRNLVQMRGVLEYGIDGIDEKFLSSIGNIDTLVDEYELCLDDPNVPKDTDGKPEPSITSDDAPHVKARLVDAKMKQVIEFADTFSWFCAILIKLEELVKNLGKDVDEFHVEAQLQKEYGPTGEPLKCPRCRQQECGCMFFFPQKR